DHPDDPPPLPPGEGRGEGASIADNPQASGPLLPASQHMTEPPEPSTSFLDDRPRPVDITALALPGPVIPWDAVLLTVALLAFLAAPFTFGLPSLAALLLTFIYSMRSENPNRTLLSLTLSLCALGALAGAALSHFWWYR